MYPDEHTLSLLRNQLRTFAAFADVGSFAAWIMVTPAGKLASLQMFLDFELTTLPAAVSDKVSVPSLRCVLKLHSSYQIMQMALAKSTCDERGHARPRWPLCAHHVCVSCCDTMPAMYQACT